MLMEIFIEALLVDEKLADQVWEVWDKGEIDDSTAALIWWRIGLAASGPNRLSQLQSARRRMEPTDVTQFFQGRNDCQTD